MPTPSEIKAKYGDFTVLKSECTVRGMRVDVRCVCGTELSLAASRVITGHMKSCGCQTKARQAAGRKTHGHSKRPEHVVWRGMVDRCTNPDNDMWSTYGGRGIAICERWKSFAAFLDDMGPRPAGKSIERRDTNGNYEPGNCFWATPLEQAHNTRRSFIWTVDGTDYPSSYEAARALGVSAGHVQRRCKRGDAGCSRRATYPTTANRSN